MKVLLIAMKASNCSKAHHTQLHNHNPLNCRIAGKFGEDLKFGDLASSLQLAKFNSLPKFLLFYILLVRV